MSWIKNDYMISYHQLAWVHGCCHNMRFSTSYLQTVPIRNDAIRKCSARSLETYSTLWQPRLLSKRFHKNTASLHHEGSTLTLSDIAYKHTPHGKNGIDIGGARLDQPEKTMLASRMSAVHWPHCGPLWLIRLSVLRCIYKAQIALESTFDQAKWNILHMAKNGLHC